jgi:hypothetical protein
MDSKESFIRAHNDMVNVNCTFLKEGAFRSVMQKEQNTSNSGRFTAFAPAPPLTAQGRKVNSKNYLAIVLKALAVVPFFDRVSFANNCTSHYGRRISMC